MYPGVLMTNSLLGLPLEEVTLGLTLPLREAESSVK